ncbi:hypothetical protein B0H11DRAFT_1993623, partial [Mycena galericulata]
MTDVHKNPDIDMTDESSKYEGLLAGPKEDTRIVLGWTLDEALKLQPPEVVDAVKADPESFLVAVLLSSSFRDRVRAPAIIKEIALNHGFDFPRVFGTITTGQGVKLPLPQPWGHFIPDCSPNTKKAALANPVMHGCIDEEFYTLYFIDPTTKQPPFLVLTYSGVSTLATETNLKEALLSKLRSDPFVTTMANADHSYVPNETKPEIILEILFHFAKIRKFNVTSNPSTEPTTAFSIILPPLSTDAAQTAELQQFLMHKTAFSFIVPFHGIATPWRNGKRILMACSECHSVAHYKDDCLILNSDSYKEFYGQNSNAGAAWHALNDERDDVAASTANNNGA